MIEGENQKPKMTIQVVLLLLIIGLCAGMLSGLIGIGGGIIVVPALVYFLGFTQHESQGTSLGLLTLPVVFLAALNYYKAGHIDIKVVGIMCIAFLIGGWLGSKISLSIPEAIVKKVFGVVLIYTAFKMFEWDAAIVRFFKNIFG
jgi:uncharacterized membrane protein YfcA